MRGQGERKLVKITTKLNIFTLKYIEIQYTHINRNTRTNFQTQRDYKLQSPIN